MAKRDSSGLRYFYQAGRLSTLLDEYALSLLVGGECVLAQLRRTEGVTKSVLLATDVGRTVLGATSVDRHAELAYLPYGFHNPQRDLSGLPAFRGELPDRALPGYSLGAGYRFFNTSLMRFQRADNLSPFDAGGINAYVYALGDPVNLFDPSGHGPEKVSFQRAKKSAEAQAIAQATKQAKSRKISRFGLRWAPMMPMLERHVGRCLTKEQSSSMAPPRLQ